MINPTKKAWKNMQQRCYNQNAPGYKNYGGRGIRICIKWRLSFKCFLKDMGRRPEGLTLERKDNDGNYTPDNCRWATRKEQQRNKRNNILLTHKGKTMCLGEWAEYLVMSRNTIKKRYAYGMPVDRILAKGDLRFDKSF